MIEPLPILKGESFPVVQSPVWTGATPVSFVATSYADILAIRGYADADRLEALVNGWQRLIQLTGAELVVCESAPTLTLAAYGGVPALMVANGFHSPPSHLAAFPTLHDGAPPAARPEALFAVVREIQRRGAARRPRRCRGSSARPTGSSAPSRRRTPTGPFDRPPPTARSGDSLGPCRP